MICCREVLNTRHERRVQNTSKEATLHLLRSHGKHKSGNLAISTQKISEQTLIDYINITLDLTNEPTKLDINRLLKKQYVN